MSPISFFSHPFNKDAMVSASASLDLMILPMLEGEPIKGIDAETWIFCESMQEQEKFSAQQGKMLLLINPPKLGPFKRILLLGLGKKSELDLPSLKKSWEKAFSTLKPYPNIGFLLPEIAETSAAKMLAQSLLVGTYQFTTYQTQSKPAAPAIQSLHVFSSHPKEVEKGLHLGQIIGTSMNYVRDLGNTPGNDLTPKDLTKEAEKLIKGHKYASIEILNEKDLLKKGMMGLLSVGKGSDNPPCLVLIRYQGGKKDAPYLSFVGKGITFDSGGISLKPGENMGDMKMDMLGAGTVLGLLRATIALKLPLNLSFTLAAAENMPSARAYKPGDILKTYSGKTIEVLNTDAEGRVALSDALTYTQEIFKPEVLIDLATLTGACITALGHEYSAAITNHQETCNAVLQAGRESLDEAWQLPLNDVFRDAVKSKIADLANIGPKGQAGTIMAAAFLEAFIEKGVRWVHLDIAGTAMQKSSSGRPLPLLVQYLLNYAETHA